MQAIFMMAGTTECTVEDNSRKTVDKKSYTQAEARNRDGNITDICRRTRSSAAMINDVFSGLNQKYQPTSKGMALKKCLGGASRRNEAMLSHAQSDSQLIKRITGNDASSCEGNPRKQENHEYLSPGSRRHAAFRLRVGDRNAGSPNRADDMMWIRRAAFVYRWSRHLDDGITFRQFIAAT